MKVEFVAPFAEATASVSEVVMGAKPSRGQLSAKPELFTALPVNILCGVNGDLEGLVMYSMSKDTALAIASLMMGSPMRVFDQTVASAISELGNMITGSSSSIFAGQGLICNITPPTLVRGNSIRISTFNTPTLVIPLIFDGVGQIEVNVSLRDTKIALAAA
ncbi:MAG: chemotaxis protein CheX [Fimbriimonas sp.]|jgi:chemotaxis protein CheX|nr:chemotaxis protein CheX [Fimbriimonas sp.]